MYRSPREAVPSCPHRANPCARQYVGTRASSSCFPCPRVTTECAQTLPPALGALPSSYLMSRPLRNRILSPALRAAFSAGLPKGTWTKGLQLQHPWLGWGPRDAPGRAPPAPGSSEWAGTVHPAGCSTQSALGTLVSCQDCH